MTPTNGRFSTSPNKLVQKGSAATSIQSNSQLIKSM